MATTEFVVVLNGTHHNPYESLGLSRNPFPAVADASLPAGVEDTLADLGSRPIVGWEDIRTRLAGWSTEFVQLCLSEYKPGRVVRFKVTFDDDPEK
jgi:hypothetical protein